MHACGGHTLVVAFHTVRIWTWVWCGHCSLQFYLLYILHVSLVTQFHPSCAVISCVLSISQTIETQSLLAENARLKEEIEELKRSLVHLETLRGSKWDMSNKQLQSISSDILAQWQPCFNRFSMLDLLFQPTSFECMCAARYQVYEAWIGLDCSVLFRLLCRIYRTRKNFREPKISRIAVFKGGHKYSRH